MLRKIIRAIAWASLAFIVFATLSPINLRPHLAGVTVERFGAFMLAGLLLGSAYPKRLGWVLAIVLGSAVGLELLQHLVPSRHGEVSDAVVKCVGGVFGICGSLVLDRIFTYLGGSRYGEGGVPQDAT